MKTKLAKSIVLLVAFAMSFGVVAAYAAEEILPEEGDGILLVEEDSILQEEGDAAVAEAEILPEEDLILPESNFIVEELPEEASQEGSMPEEPVIVEIAPEESLPEPVMEQEAMIPEEIALEEAAIEEPSQEILPAEEEVQEAESILDEPVITQEPVEPIEASDIEIPDSMEMEDQNIAEDAPVSKEPASKKEEKAPEESVLEEDDMEVFSDVVPRLPDEFYALNDNSTGKLGISLSVAYETAGHGADTVEISRKDSGNWKIMTRLPIAQDGGTFQYLDVNVKPGTTYFYRVRTYNKSSKKYSEYSQEISRTCLQTPEVKVESAKSGITITWNAVPGAQSYSIIRSPSNDASTIAITGEPVASGITKTSYVDKTVPIGEAKYYFVIAIKDASSSPAGVSKMAAIRFDKPLRFQVINGIDKTKLIPIWEEVDGASKYYLYRKVKGGEWEKLAETTKTSYEDTAIEKGVVYSYGVRAYNKYAKVFSDLATSSGFLMAPPKTIKTEAVSGGVKLSWSKAAKANSYSVYRKAAGGKWKCIAENVTGTAYTDKTVPANAIHYYAVSAYNKSRKDMSAYDTKGVAAVHFSKVSGLKATIAGSKTTITWKKTPAAKRYIVYQKQSGKWVKLGTTAGTSYTVKQKKAGTYMVKAYRVIGEKNYYGMDTTVKSK